MKQSTDFLHCAWQCTRNDVIVYCTNGVELLTSVVNFSRSLDPVTNYDKQVSYDEGNFRAYWAYDSDTDSLTFKLVVKATGWVAFGFARARGNMLDYDVAVGGVWNGQGYLEVNSIS